MLIGREHNKRDTKQNIHTNLNINLNLSFSLRLNVGSPLSKLSLLPPILLRGKKTAPRKLFQLQLSPESQGDSRGATEITCNHCQQPTLLLLAC